MIRQPSAFFVAENSPLKTWKDIEAEAKKRPLKVGDYIVVTVTVTAKRQHRKRNRNFGWVWVRQVIARADGKPCYIRKAMYAVLKKPLESS